MAVSITWQVKFGGRRFLSTFFPFRFPFPFCLYRTDRHMGLDWHGMMADDIRIRTLLCYVGQVGMRNVAEYLRYCAVLCWAVLVLALPQAN